MRITAALILFFSATSTSAAPSQRQQSLMDEIERTIRLPEGANPLSSYGRNYAYSGESTVIA
ncbi:hypothetical protein ABTF80_19815, partial [Acinetobacter baumannii]